MYIHQSIALFTLNKWSFGFISIRVNVRPQNDRTYRNIFAQTDYTVTSTATWSDRNEAIISSSVRLLCFFCLHYPSSSKPPTVNAAEINESMTSRRQSHFHFFCVCATAAPSQTTMAALFSPSTIHTMMK